MRRAVLAVAVEQRHDRHLAHVAETALDAEPLALGDVHVPALATNVGLVNFHIAAQLAATDGLHGETDTLQHEPRRLLGDANGAVNFPRTDAVLAVGDKPHNGEPLLKRNR